MTDERTHPGRDAVPDHVDLTAAGGEELRRELSRLEEEELDLAGRLEAVRGRMRLVRSALAGRALTDVSAAELARVLLGSERERGEA